MPLTEYIVERDRFELEPLPIMGLDFPCIVCKHQQKADSAEPCRSCDHNVAALQRRQAAKDARQNKELSASAD